MVRDESSVNKWLLEGESKAWTTWRMEDGYIRQSEVAIVVWVVWVENGAFMCFWWCALKCLSVDDKVQITES